MRSSKFGVIVFILLVVLGGTSCSYYSRVMARKNLVDGSKAYKDRKFAEAEQQFRLAAERDPKGETLEGRTAQLFLARTLHSEYIGDRSKKNLAEAAIEAYKQALPAALREYTDARAAYDKAPADAAATRRYASALSDAVTTLGAVSGLYDNIQAPDQAVAWRNQVANDANNPETARAAAYNSMAAKSNTCANDITDTEATKKQVTENGKDVFHYVKPANAADIDTLKKCIQEGTDAADKAMALEPQSIKSAGKSFDVKGATDEALRLYQEMIKPFESSRSYKAAMTVQSMRLAEMEGRKEDADRLKAESEQLRQSYNELGDLDNKIQQEMDDRAAAKEAAEQNARSNSNANSSK